MADQSAPTIARLFCRHGVPGEIISDRGAAFLAKLMLEVCRIKKAPKIEAGCQFSYSCPSANSAKSCTLCNTCFEGEICYTYFSSCAHHLRFDKPYHFHTFPNYSGTTVPYKCMVFLTCDLCSLFLNVLN